MNFQRNTQAIGGLQLFIQIKSLTFDLHDSGFFCGDNLTVFFMPYINRLISDSILTAVKYYPAILLTGPRQSGKTTLARHLFPDYTFVNIEDISTRNRTIDDLNSFLDGSGPRVIIDEVQNLPEILSSIQARIDNDKSLRYILTGSNNFPLLHNSMQTLAGRTALFTVLPIFPSGSPKRHNYTFTIPACSVIF